MASAPSLALRELLDRKLDTLEKLELVLALRGAPNQTATIDALAHELQIGRGVMAQLASDVARSRIVSVADDSVTLSADASEIPLLDEASALYANDRREVMRLMSTIAMDKIRRMAARSFADAFTFRKKKDDDRG